MACAPDFEDLGEIAHLTRKNAVSSSEFSFEIQPSSNFKTCEGRSQSVLNHTVKGGLDTKW